MEYFPQVASQFKGELWTANQRARERFDLHWIRSLDMGGLSRNSTYIHQGKNSGYQAINLAYHWGAKRIILLGYDFMKSGGMSHWHGDHPRPMGNGGNFPDWIAEMRLLARELDKEGIEVINCSRKTALKCFKQSSIDQVFSWQK